MITGADIKSQEKRYEFENIISLGHFCAPAMQLEKYGFRRASYPFDWLIIRDFKLVLQLLDKGFDNSDFLNIKYFAQAKIKKNVYQNTKTKVRFLHDFNEYHSLESQFESFSDKYIRRMKRFQKDIKKPTLFIRYIGGKDELDYIEQNYGSIDDLIKSKCIDNEIIYVCDKNLKPNIDVFTTTVGTKVVNFDFFEDSNSELLTWLRINYAMAFVYRKKRKSIAYNIKKFFYKILRKEYTHCIIYDDLD